jgi:hypothetical protein
MDSQDEQDFYHTNENPVYPVHPCKKEKPSVD